MTFYASPVEAAEKSPVRLTNYCFCCSGPLAEEADGPVIAYDACLTPGGYTRVLMHRDCAFAMAQRIICDAWPNRRAGDKHMMNNR